MSNHAEEVLIGLGGNIGDPLASMQAALKAIDAHEQCSVVRFSSIWKTPPWGITDQPDFLNACAAISTSLNPRAFLETCLAIEQDLKRVRHKRWGPRSIDLDILFFGNRIIDETGLTVPHPRIMGRAFVLVPLAEIASDMVMDGQTVGQLAARSNQVGMSKAFAPDWYTGH